MSQGSCPVECSDHPEKLSSYTDLSGIGFGLANTITAGLAVTIVVLYYGIAYRPEVPPFGTSRDGSSPHKSSDLKPNPVDECILRLARRKRAPAAESSQKQTRMQHALTKCMIIMSDLQLITGLSILISGFAQLRCGISAYHWRKLVDIAWFASVTHLTCLTFLRGHLHQKRFARVWRVASMVIMIIMLIVALIPTGNYQFADYAEAYDAGYGDKYRPSPSDYAICYFQFQIRTFDSSPWADTVWSAVLLGLGIVIRLHRLHRASTWFAHRIRSFCSQYSILLLEKVQSFSNSGSTCKKKLFYYPVLALFLLLRLALDFWPSMVFEVWWVVVSMVWGTIKLWRVHSLPPGWHEPGVQEWTFGQVLPLIMLSAPVMAMIESFRQDIHNHQDHISCAGSPSDRPLRLPTPAPSTTVSAMPNISTTQAVTAAHPAVNFYQYAWMRFSIMAFIIALLCHSVLLLWGSSLTSTVNVITDVYHPGRTPSLNAPFILFYSLLYPLAFETFAKSKRRTYTLFRAAFYVSIIFNYVLPLFEYLVVVPGNLSPKVAQGFVYLGWSMVAGYGILYLVLSLFITV